MGAAREPARGGERGPRPWSVVRGRLSVVGCRLSVVGCQWFWCRCNGRRATDDGQGQVGPVIADELDDAGESWVIAQLEVVLARDIEGGSHGREGLGLLDRVDAQVG